VSDIVTGVRQLIQDLIAPDFKALVARQDATEKRFDSIGRRFDSIDKRLDRQDKYMALQTEVLVKTIEAFRAEMRSEFAILRSDMQLEIQTRIAPLSEHVAVLEARSQ
jgi:hypothetical protein